VTHYAKANVAGELALASVTGYTPRHFARLFRSSTETPHVPDRATPYASTHPGATAQEPSDAILKSTVPTDSMY
jgi:hypothetical protein